MVNFIASYVNPGAIIRTIIGDNKIPSRTIIEKLLLIY